MTNEGQLTFAKSASFTNTIEVRACMPPKPVTPEQRGMFSIPIHAARRSGNAVGGNGHRRPAGCG